ncbi:hypothetical protein QYE76_069215 [Lolium multiflorum]|uniref:Retrotransposon protein n=1 Tax=Lolium multiflorum TaxID=4521 RepID=A0AAD8WDA5_LOLMU|nr:hypothetical protein QYE76_069215 [Lolium multiflorum]
MEHWAVKNILKYLKRTKDMFLCYGGDQELVVNGYTDASRNTDPDDSKSQSGYVFILNGAAVSWASSKQCTVAKSSTESEYIAASEASSEAVWMKRFIVELGVVPSALDPLIIYCDNMGAIANAQEPRSHKRLKHIKLRYHSIREYIEDGETWTPTLGIHLYNEGPREGAGHPKTTSWPPPLKWPATPSQTLAASPPYSPRSLAKLRRTSSPPPTPRRRAVGFKRSYYFRCPLEREVDVIFINNRTCDRVRRCCPFVAPEPIVIKIFYALLQAASDRLPQQQEPPLVGFGISSRANGSEVPHLNRVHVLREEGDQSLIRSRGLHDIMFDDMPAHGVESTSEAIRSRGFVRLLRLDHRPHLLLRERRLQVRQVMCPHTEKVQQLLIEVVDN